MSEVIRVCTFNLRRDDVDNGTPNEWSRRRPIVRDCLKHIQPTIMGTQEGHPEQLNDILKDLNESIPCWSWIGEPLDTWSTSNAIFYRHDLLSLLSTKTFWFNEDPTKAVAAWGCKNPRGCTRADFEHAVTKQKFIIFNLHLDFPSQLARHHSIPILLSSIGNEKDEVIVTGDFNNWPEMVDGETPLDELIAKGQVASEIRQMKAAGFVDTYQHDETPTFNGFRTAGYGPKIDFIWITSNSVYRIHGETKVDQFHNEHGFFPSDHFPVYTDLIRSPSTA